MGIYKRRRRPAAAIRPGAAVCIAPAIPEELEELAVAELAAADALLDAEETLLLREETWLLTDDSSEERAPEAEDATLAPATPEEKTVVEPTVEVKVEEPEVMVETMADVVTAELVSPPAEVELEPDPPTPPTPRIVVDPTVVKAPPDSVETMADVVIAEEDSEELDPEAEDAEAEESVPAVLEIAVATGVVRVVRVEAAKSYQFLFSWLSRIAATYIHLQRQRSRHFRKQQQR